MEDEDFVCVVYCKCTNNDANHVGSHPFIEGVCGHLWSIEIIPADEIDYHRVGLPCVCNPVLDDDGDLIHKVLTKEITKH